jgi:hypothetical protein
VPDRRTQDASQAQHDVFKSDTPFTNHQRADRMALQRNLFYSIGSTSGIDCDDRLSGNCTTMIAANTKTIPAT